MQPIPVETSKRLMAIVQGVFGTYHPLVWVVAESSEGASAVLARVAKHHNTSVASLGVLAEQLAPLTRPQRRRSVDALLEALARPDTRLPVFMDHAEVLFEPSLAIRVGAQMERLSRLCRALVVVWPGTVGGRELHYATPGHPEHEHQSHPIGTCPLIRLDSELAVLPD